MHNLDLIEQVIKWQVPIYILTFNLYVFLYLKIKNVKQFQHSIKSISIISVVSFLSLFPIYWYYKTVKAARIQQIELEIINSIPTPNAIPVESVIANLSNNYEIPELYEVVESLERKEQIYIDNSVECNCDLDAIGDRSQKLKLMWNND